MTEQARPVGRVIEAGGGSFIALVDRALAKYPDIGDPVWIADPQFLDALPERNGPLTDSHTLRLILELIESIQDTQEQLVELVGSIAGQVDEQRAMLAALDVARSFPETKRTDELRTGDTVWWPWVEGDPIAVTLADVRKCGGSNPCWFVVTTPATESRAIHSDADEEWQMATPGERMAFE